jgi:hypothetical protein
MKIDVDKMVAVIEAQAKIKPPPTGIGSDSENSALNNNYDYYSTFGAESQENDAEKIQNLYETTYLDDELLRYDKNGQVHYNAPMSQVPITISANKIKSRPVPWLIPDFLVRKSLNSIQGLPDGGKTWLLLALVAAVARGGLFPDNYGVMQKVKKGRVLYANYDDSLEYTIKPRLESMGLTAEDFGNVTFITSESQITFSDKRLEAAFEEVKPDLAIFDTLQNFIGAKTQGNEPARGYYIRETSKYIYHTQKQGR